MGVAMHRRLSHPRAATAGDRGHQTRRRATGFRHGEAAERGVPFRDRHSDSVPATRGLIETSKQVSLAAPVHNTRSHLVNMTCINTRDQHILHCNLAIASTQSHKHALHEHKKASTQSLVLSLSSSTTTRKKTTLMFSRSIEISCFANKNRAITTNPMSQGM